MKQMVDSGFVDVGFVPFASTVYYFGGAFGVFDLQEDETAA